MDKSESESLGSVLNTVMEGEREIYMCVCVYNVITLSEPGQRVWQ